MERTRVMLAWLPTMLLEILERAARSMRIDVVCVLSDDDDDLAHALLRWRPHAIVLGMRSTSSSTMAGHLLAREGKLCIMTVPACGRRATVHRTDAPPVTLDNVSPHDLLGTLEAIVGVTGAGRVS